ncbi:15-hydroxyprostaglandin dehydrogenase [Aaosphaeria arxii CBS 175.79]|uniref:15-hydroxyprostaglandin dehydrogenase n=1 Tax=Aaosphaeria arxii CBS 175.79 TaxID=1450172 RepID=A0A6A5Y191_9PLEO|nr:15-hydroxyprostaglandin dehydrogenase [Aaosphaeria arxii CBS 175.79]KAF2018324.1 15-hydroxyprostaglandin dehydrogenase [Aaosphaeria arxii CBS 175.79]
MGLEVAKSLTQLPNWKIHILDLHPTRGEQAASTLGATFHQTNVTDYTSLSSTFNTIFQTDRRIDFVFANAGIAEHANFYEDQAVDPPPEPKGMHAIVDINLKSVINTASLALHYMRKTPSCVDKSLVMTASCGGLYPSYYSPMYTATKHAVVGFMRSIAPLYYKTAGIRVNAICPGTVKTNLLTSDEWKNFPEEYFTPVEKIAKVVVMLVAGEDDGKGRGKAVEVCGWKHYYREQVDYCDEAMKAVMGATDIEVLDNATHDGVPNGK